MNTTSGTAVNLSTTYAQRVAAFTARVALYTGNGVGHVVARERARADVIAMYGA